MRREMVQVRMTRDDPHGASDLRAEAGTLHWWLALSARRALPKDTDPSIVCVSLKKSSKEAHPCAGVGQFSVRACHGRRGASSGRMRGSAHHVDRWRRSHWGLALVLSAAHRGTSHVDGAAVVSPACHL